VSRTRSFAQVDVFASGPYSGNPLAVVLDADGIEDAMLARFAAWTNLSETTFVLPPTDPTADYRVRIFTPGNELPFAGHPTLGTAHAWLEAGGIPKRAEEIVQECGLGLIRIRRDGDLGGAADVGGAGGRLAFAAPPPVRTGRLAPALLAQVTDSLRLEWSQVVDHQWVDNGPGWVAVLLSSAAEVLALEPDFARMGSLMVGAVGPGEPGGQTQFEVRAFAPAIGVAEDPVTGSLNAGIAQWLIGSGRAPTSYQASQGARVGRAGRIFLDSVDGTVWVGGRSVTCIRGSVDL
jgi:PhzF family phenazine biosynthesis protein